MAASGFAYGCFDEYILKETILFTTDENAGLLRGALVTSAYTPNTSTHVKWSDISANEIANGNGYTTGGIALTNVTETRNGLTTTIDMDDLVWVANGGPIPAFRYVVFYDLVTRAGIVNPIMWYQLCDNTPADIAATADGGTLRLRVNAAGIWAVT